MKTLPQNLLPMLAWWPKVTRQTLRDDALAGLSGAIIVLPQGVAYSRWFFFAQANHPQNLYYQMIS